MTVQRFPNGPRLETGVVQVGQDLPGVFIRGDEAIALAIALRGVMRMSNAQSYHMAPVIGLARQFNACSKAIKGE